jgi:ketosteroid isomerase-like protein
MLFPQTFALEFGQPDRAVRQRPSEQLRHTTALPQGGLFNMYRPYASAAASSSGFLDVDSAIRGLTQDLSMAFNTGNYDQASALFASEGTLMPPHREQSQGIKAIERALRDLGDLGHHDLRFETFRVEYSGDVAVEIGRYTVAISQENGTTVVERGKYLRAWRRLGAWLISADCWNSNLASGK